MGNPLRASARSAAAWLTEAYYPQRPRPLRRMKKNIYYDKSKILGYNALTNVILGERGVGKTYGFKLHCVKKCIEDQREFIYLRRYKTEIKAKEMQTFFEDINHLFDNKLMVKSNVFYYGDQRIGQAVALSTYVSNKGINKKSVDYIIYDEYILDRAGGYKYLPKDWETFLEFYFSIARLENGDKMRAVYVYVLGNKISCVNPLFTYYGVSIPMEFRGIKKINPEVVIEITDNKAYQEVIEKQRAYDMIRGTAYADYAFGNTFLRDNDAFIEKKTGDGWKYYFTIGYESRFYGVFISYSENKIIVTQSYDESFPRKYTFTLKDHSPNTLLIHEIKRDFRLSKFRWAFDNGLVRFENQQIKNDCYNINQLLK